MGLAGGEAKKRGSCKREEKEGNIRASMALNVGFTAEESRKGGLARAASMTPERRSEIAAYAAQVKWASRELIGIYPRRGDALRRIDFHLRALDRLASRALLEEDYGEARRCIQAMGGFERLKIFVMDSMGRKGGLAMPLDTETETSRLEESRKRRERALGGDVSDAEEVNKDG